MSITGYLAWVLFIAFVLRLVDYYAQNRFMFYQKLERNGIPKGLSKWGATKIK